MSNLIKFAGDTASSFKPSPLADLDIRLSRAYGTMHATCTWIAACVDTYGSIEAIPENVKSTILSFVAKRMAGIQEAEGRL